MTKRLLWLPAAAMICASASAALAGSSYEQRCTSGYYRGHFASSCYSVSTYTAPKREAPTVWEPASSETVRVDRGKVERLMKIDHSHEPGTVELTCPPPYHMTARDGCQ